MMRGLIGAFVVVDDPHGYVTPSVGVCIVRKDEGTQAALSRSYRVLDHIPNKVVEPHPYHEARKVKPRKPKRLHRGLR